MGIKVTEYCNKCKKETHQIKENNKKGLICNTCGNTNFGGIKLGDQYKDVFDKLKERFK